MRAVDGRRFSNIDATPDVFELFGGRYFIGVIATWNTGSVTFQRQGPNGVTLMTLSAETTFTDDGVAFIDIPHGFYTFAIATATAVYIDIERIPGE